MRHRSLTQGGPSSGESLGLRGPRPFAPVEVAQHPPMIISDPQEIVDRFGMYGVGHGENAGCSLLEAMHLPAEKPSVSKRGSRSTRVFEVSAL